MNIGHLAPAERCLAGLLRGEEVAWTGIEVPDLAAACQANDLTCLIFERLQAGGFGSTCPTSVRDALGEAARMHAATELLRRREITAVLETLAANGIGAILIKGTPLAYTHYGAAWARPREDTDLVIRREDVEAARRVMDALGYAATPYCDGELLFCQFEMAKTDSLGVHHAFDFHWKISTQSLFADLLSYDTLARDAIAVPPLGRAARAAGPVHALLISCVHPAMHHRNEERLLWLYDVHLLVSRLHAAELEQFAALALHARVAAVCADQLGRARTRLGTAVPDGVMEMLRTNSPDEPSSVYLRAGRRWQDDVLSNIQGLPSWRARAKLVREILIPSPRYMFAAYGLPERTMPVLLPALYVRRLVSGARKVLFGRK